MNGIDSKVPELTSFVKTGIHDACEQTKSIAREVGGREAYTVGEPHATRNSSLPTVEAEVHRFSNLYQDVW